MQMVPFPGSIELAPPADSPPGQYIQTWARADLDKYGHHSIVVAWKPSYEDLKALNRGELIYLNVTGKSLPSMNVFTLDENGYSNDPGALDEL